MRLTRLPAGVPARHRAEIAATTRYLRAHANDASIALSLLPSQFTLGELQATYELLLGAPVYTATFRRWVRSSTSIVPSGRTRVEQRGRPAQLYRAARRGASAAQPANLRRFTTPA